MFCHFQWKKTLLPWCHFLLKLYEMWPRPFGLKTVKSVACTVGNIFTGFQLLSFELWALMGWTDWQMYTWCVLLSSSDVDLFSWYGEMCIPLHQLSLSLLTCLLCHVRRFHLSRCLRCCACGSESQFRLCLSDISSASARRWSIALLVSCYGFISSNIYEL